MGLKVSFQEDFFCIVQHKFRNVTHIQTRPFYIVSVNNLVYVNLITLNTNFTAQQLLSLQIAYEQQGIFLVHLWEDVWIRSKQQALSRLNSFCGLNKVVHGRKTKIIVPTFGQTKDFLETHHLQGYVKTTHNFGLVLENDLIAVACFAAPRIMKSRGENHKSAELIRFATKTGFTIIGGLGKLLKHFQRQISVDDLMTYADRDWSLGKGYDKLGFEIIGQTKAIFFYIDTATMQRHYAHRLPPHINAEYNAQNDLNLDEFMKERGFLKAFNTGNLKYLLHINA